MQFELRAWRKSYNKVKRLGQEIIDSRPDKDGNPPVLQLSSEERALLATQIASLTKKSSLYLDQSGMRMPQPLWIYKQNDPTSWISDPSFAYGHLLTA